MRKLRTSRNRAIFRSKVHDLKNAKVYCNAQSPEVKSSGGQHVLDRTARVSHNPTKVPVQLFSPCQVTSVKRNLIKSKSPGPTGCRSGNGSSWLSCLQSIVEDASPDFHARMLPSIGPYLTYLGSQQVFMMWSYLKVSRRGFTDSSVGIHAAAPR